jgi:hypothetical protein
MDKKVRENILTASAKIELAKIQSLVNSDCVTAEHHSSTDDKLRKDIILRDDLIKEERDVSDRLLDRIDGRAEALEDILCELNANEVEIENSLNLSNGKINELRTINPAKASELEDSVIQKKKKSQNKHKRK